MTINVRSAILAEMLAMWIGGMLVQWDADNKTGKTSAPTYVGDLFIHRGLNSGLWVLVLGVVLLGWAEVFHTGLPAKVGFMIAASTLLYEGVKISGAFEKLITVSQVSAGSGENVVRPAVTS